MMAFQRLSLRKRRTGHRQVPGVGVVGALVFATFKEYFQGSEKVSADRSKVRLSDRETAQIDESEEAGKDETEAEQRIGRGGI